MRKYSFNTCFARRRCSRVWGIVPSVAATTRIAPSICAVPVIIFCNVSTHLHVEEKRCAANTSVIVIIIFFKSVTEFPNVPFTITLLKLYFWCLINAIQTLSISGITIPQNSSSSQTLPFNRRYFGYEFASMLTNKLLAQFINIETNLR